MRFLLSATTVSREVGEGMQKVELEVEGELSGTPIKISMRECRQLAEVTLKHN